ncbi:MAG: porin family protein [Bacteroidales bacterium]|nr:porin family protein [Bacteroidales bacterium]
MKKVLAVIFAVVLFSGVSSFAQEKSPWSVNAGYLNSTISVSQSGVSASIDFNGFFAGVAYDIPLNVENNAIQLGAYWDFKTAKAGGQSSSVHFLRIPVHYKYSTPLNETVSLFISAGPSINVGLFGEDEPFEDGGLKRVNVQIGAAAGLEFNNRFFIKLGYDYGVTKGMDLDVTNRINAFQIGVGLCF